MQHAYPCFLAGTSTPTAVTPIMSAPLTALYNTSFSKKKELPYETADECDHRVFFTERAHRLRKLPRDTYTTLAFALYATKSDGAPRDSVMNTALARAAYLVLCEWLSDDDERKKAGGEFGSGKLYCFIINRAYNFLDDERAFLTKLRQLERQDFLEALQCDTQRTLDATERTEFLAVLAEHGLSAPSSWVSPPDYPEKTLHEAAVCTAGFVPDGTLLFNGHRAKCVRRQQLARWKGKPIPFHPLASS